MGALAGGALDAVADLLDERPYVRHLEILHRIGQQLDLDGAAGGEGARRTLRDHERHARIVPLDEHGSRGAAGDVSQLDHALARELLAERPAHSPAVLVGDGKDVGGRSERIGAIEAREREACHGDDDDGRDRQKHETDAVACQEPKILADGRRERAQHHCAPSSPSRRR